MVSSNRLRIAFYTLWISTLAIQCWLVGLSGDEAYYWRYSRELAWGYFDHPPLTALLVKAGYIVSNNEFGVRLFFLAVLTAMVMVLEKLVRPGDLKLFYAIVLSIAFLQVGIVWGGGMMAIPDFPLLFFEALFFLVYRKYLENPSWHTYVVLPIVISLMLLTKYHGILIVGFTVLSNPRLMARGSFWAIVALSTLFLAPHISWQVTHDFPSLRYHLLDRSSDPYSFSFTTEYLGSQLFVLGPIIGILLIYLGIIFKPANDFERSLKFVAAGTYLFFLLMTFKGRVEANWTIITLIPLVYMGYKHIDASSRLRSITMYGFSASICLIIAMRVIITADLPVPGLSRFSESLVPWKWCDELKTKTGGKPAVFINSYQKAALYEFYTGVPSFSLNNFWGRKNQYTIWDTEADFQGQEVALIANWEMPTQDSVRIAAEYFPFTMIRNFRSSSNVGITSNLQGPVMSRMSAEVDAIVSFTFDNEHTRNLDANEDFQSAVIFGFFQGTTLKESGSTLLVLKNNMIGNSLDFPIKIRAPSVPGRYSLFLAVSTGWLPPGINSLPIEFIVEE